MHARNCWEYKKCGRQPGGNKVAQFGLCPATIDDGADGLNRGRFAGRICWAVSGTFCGGEIQGTFAEKHATCTNCDFFSLVCQEENIEMFKLLKPGQIFKPVF
ncbi:MAG: hypothetical protein HY423_05470 [Candidatus Lambdaproteobacteria bacterium]|nr:hypothetical protein [Candidatus Lambdaproteobacteria bacterium]